MSTPAAEVRSFAVTIPAGTAQDDPYTADIYFPARDVVAVSWRVPPGPSGLMGWRLTMSGGQVVIPTGGGWIVADDQYDTWPLTGFPDSGYWEVTGYNTGAYDHTVYLDFLLDLITEAVSSPQIVSIAPGTVTTPVTTSTPVTTPVSVSTGITTPVTTSTPYVSTPPVSIPPVTTPPPVSIPPVTTPTVTTPPPVTTPPVTVPPPVTVKQPVFADIVVPNVTGMRRDAAGELLTKSHLTPRYTGPEGVVTAQSPKAGALVKTGSTVTLTIRVTGAGPLTALFKLPDVVGKRREDAGAQLRAADLVPVFSAAQGTVRAQDPKAGTYVKAGSTVHLTLAGS